MAERIQYRRCAHGLDGRVAAGTLRLHADGAELRQVLHERIVELEFAFFVEHQQRDARDRLGHREVAEVGVDGHRLAVLDVGHARGVKMNDSAAARDERHDAGGLLRRDEIRRVRGNALQAFGRHADALGSRARQLGGERGSGQEPCSTGNGRSHDSVELAHVSSRVSWWATLAVLYASVLGRGDTAYKTPADVRAISRRLRERAIAPGVDGDTARRPARVLSACRRRTAARARRRPPPHRRRDTASSDRYSPR